MGQEVPTGDAVFDERFRVTGAPDADPAPVLRVLSAPLRALLLAHDVMFVMVRGDGFWTMFRYGERLAVIDTEHATVQTLQLLVSG